MFVILSFVTVSSGSADTVSINGLALESAGLKDETGKPRLYGATRPEGIANWHITQWNAAADLPNFALGDDGRWATANQWASILWTPPRRSGDSGPDREQTIVLTQSGPAFPCSTMNGDPNEFDVLVEPNAWSSGGYPNADLEATMPTLDMLASFRMAGSYEMLSSAQGLGSCKANHAYASISITLANITVHPAQILWYSIVISTVCGGKDESPGSDLYFCQLGVASPSVWWFWTGGMSPNPHISDDGVENFAIHDVMASFGMEQVGEGEKRLLSMDFAGRLKDLVSAGRHGIDSNPAHWKISTVNYGLANWGTTSIATQWRGFVPDATLKHSAPAAH